MAGLLSDDEEGTTKKPPRTESKMASEKGPAPVRDQGREAGLGTCPGADAVGRRLAGLRSAEPELCQAGTVGLRCWTEGLSVSPNGEVGCVTLGLRGGGIRVLWADRTCAMLAVTRRGPGCRETPPSSHSDSTVEGTVGHGHCPPCYVF